MTTLCRHNVASPVLEFGGGGVVDGGGSEPQYMADVSEPPAIYAR